MTPSRVKNSATTTFLVVGSPQLQTVKVLGKAIKGFGSLPRWLQTLRSCPAPRPTGRGGAWSAGSFHRRQRRSPSPGTAPGPLPPQRCGGTPAARASRSPCRRSCSGSRRIRGVHDEAPDAARPDVHLVNGGREPSRAHHSEMRAGSVHASNTRCRGASNTRVIVISRSVDVLVSFEAAFLISTPGRFKSLLRQQFL